MKEFFEKMFSIDRYNFDNYISCLVDEKWNKQYIKMKEELEKSKEEVKKLKEGLSLKSNLLIQKELEKDSLEMIKFQYESKYPERYEIEFGMDGYDDWHGWWDCRSIPWFRIKPEEAIEKLETPKNKSQKSNEAIEETLPF